MNSFSKLMNNFGSAGFCALGVKLYVRMLWSAIIHFPSIVQSRNLVPLDKAMGPYARRFLVNGTTVHFDCGLIDSRYHDGTFSFGIVREIYIRNCYFTHMPAYVFSLLRNAVDLGANRGCMTAFLASKCSKVISVEANSDLAGIARLSAEANSNGGIVEVINAFVGTGGMFETLSPKKISIGEICNRFSGAAIDFMKIDIEGSEFSLFSEIEWLEHVNSIAMEVHRDFGNPNELVEKLSSSGFDVICADENLHLVSEPSDCDFIYAARPLEKFTARSGSGLARTRLRKE